jgi:hypothetical protein
MNRALILLAVAVAVAACGGLGPHPTSQLTTVNPAWVSWFTLDYGADGDGSARRVSGYVHNGYGEEAAEVMLLTQALDRAGAVLGQHVTIAGSVPPLSRKYFEVRNLPAADQYRVTVWSFTFQQSPGWL